MFSILCQPCFAEGSIEEYKCDLMIKGYEFSNEGLSEAIIKNDKEAVELFVKADININLPDNEGYSALDRAIKVKNKDTFLLLCRAGGETKLLQIPDELALLTEQQEEQTQDEISENIQIALAKAQNQKTKETIEEEAIDPQMNKLCDLVNKNLIEDVAKIAKNSPDLNKLTAEGLAPVHYAVFNDNPAMVHLLLGEGANVNQKTSDGLTPLDIAVLNNQTVVARVILEYGGSMSVLVARELMKFGCNTSYNENTDLYDASFESIFGAMEKIRNKLQNEQ